VQLDTLTMNPAELVPLTIRIRWPVGFRLRLAAFRLVLGVAGWIAPVDVAVTGEWGDHGSIANRTGDPT
jgi:hypothetical protein